MVEHIVELVEARAREIQAKDAETQDAETQDAEVLASETLEPGELTKTRPVTVAAE
jgi:hypothetical protein